MHHAVTLAHSGSQRDGRKRRVGRTQKDEKGMAGPGGGKKTQRTSTPVDVNTGGNFKAIITLTIQVSYEISF